MRKSYLNLVLIFMSPILLVAGDLFSQNESSVFFNREIQGTVIWQTDFDGADWSETSDNGVAVPENAPAGWELNDETGNGFHWRWDVVGPRGLFTSSGDDCHVPREPLNSATSENGFLMMEPDHYNTSADCEESFEVDMDASVTYTGGIDCSDLDVVCVVFEQWNRFCCMSYQALFEVSMDEGQTWISYSQVGELAVGNGNATITSIDISSVAANQSNVQFRFNMQELSHYYWLIDDVRFIEPYDYNMALEDYWCDYIESAEPVETSDFVEGFYEYPAFLANPFKGFHLAYRNDGSIMPDEFTHVVEVKKNNQSIGSVSAPIESNISFCDQDTSHVYFTWGGTTLGNYSIQQYLSSANTDESPYNDTLTHNFKIGENILSPINFNNINDRVSTSDFLSYQYGGGIGFIANLPDPNIHLGTSSYYVLDGLNAYIAEPINDEELALFTNGLASAVIDAYQLNDGVYNQVLTSSEYVLSVNDIGSVVSIPYALDMSGEYITDGGKYLFVLRMYGTYIDEYSRTKTWSVGSLKTNKVSKESSAIVGGSVGSYPENQIGRIYDRIPAISITIHSPGMLIGRSVEFHVVDLNSQPVANALVSLGIDEVMTNASGNAVFEDLMPIEYSYTVSKTGFPDYNSVANFQEETELTVTLDGVGITANIHDFAIYPNPSKGIFNAVLNEQAHVQVVTISGQLVYDNVVSGNVTIDLSNEESGIYLIKVVSETGTSVKKLMVE